MLTSCAYSIIKKEKNRSDRRQQKTNNIVLFNAGRHIKLDLNQANVRKQTQINNLYECE